MPSFVPSFVPRMSIESPPGTVNYTLVVELLSLTDNNNVGNTKPLQMDIDLTVHYYTRPVA